MLCFHCIDHVLIGCSLWAFQEADNGLLFPGEDGKEVSVGLSCQTCGMRRSEQLSAYITQAMASS